MNDDATLIIRHCEADRAVLAYDKRSGRLVEVWRSDNAPRAADAGAGLMRWYHRLVWWGVALLLGLGLVGGFAAGAEGLPPGQWVCAVASAYSPHDELDAAYHATKGAWRWRTADGTDVRSVPYGIAVPVAWLGRRVYVPAGQGYLDATRPDARWFRADDTGAVISRRSIETDLLHVDLRYRFEASAKAFGVRRVWIFIADEEARP